MAPSVNHYTEVHFEDIVADTEGSLRRICDFIDLEFDPVMLDYHERAEGRLATGGPRRFGQAELVLLPHEQPYGGA